MILNIFILASVGAFTVLVLIRYFGQLGKAATQQKSLAQPHKAKRERFVCDTIARKAKAAPAKYYEEEEESVSTLPSTNFIKP